MHHGVQSEAVQIILCADHGRLPQDVDLDARRVVCAAPPGGRSEALAYDLLVGADGAGSAVRQLLQARARVPARVAAWPS